MGVLLQYKGWLLSLMALVLVAFAVPFGLGYGLLHYWMEEPIALYESIGKEPWRSVNVNTGELQYVQDFETARTHLSKMKQTHDPLIATFLEGELYRAQGQFDQARESYQVVLNAIDPSEYWGYTAVKYQYVLDDARGELGLLQYLAGQTDEAKANLAQIEAFDIQRDPERLYILENVLHDPSRGDLHFALAKVFREMLWLPEARQELQLAEANTHDPKLKLAIQTYQENDMPKWVTQVTPMARYFCLAGDQAQHAGNPTQAIHFYKAALHQQPKLEWTYHHLSLAYGENRQYGKAAMYAQQALKMNPDFLLPHVTLGDIALEQQRYEDAIKHFAKIIGQSHHSLDPDRATMVANLENQMGFAYEKLGRFQVAKQHYGSAIDLSQEGSEDYHYAELALLRLQKKFRELRANHSRHEVVYHVN